MKTSKRLIILAIVAIIFIILAIQITFIRVKECTDFECFKEAMQKCNKAIYINEEAEATWKYQVIGTEGVHCLTEVTLLQPKAGELGIEQLSGFSMVCEFPKGIAAYPERDLERCHGRLKEDLQSIVIKKLHTYIIENIGELEQGLELIISQS